MKRAPAAEARPPAPKRRQNVPDDSSDSSSNAETQSKPAHPPAVAAIVESLKPGIEEDDMFGNPVTPSAPRFPSERAVSDEYRATAASAGNGGIKPQQNKTRRSRSQKAGQFAKQLDRLFPDSATTSKALAASRKIEDALTHSTLPSHVPRAPPPPKAKADFSRTNDADVRPMAHYYSTFEPSVVKTAEQLVGELCAKLYSQLVALHSDQRMSDVVPYEPPEQFPEFQQRVEEPPYRQRMAALTQNRELKAPHVPLVARAYLAKYRRPANPMLHERPCASAMDCMSLRLPNHPLDLATNSQRFGANTDRLFFVRQALSAHAVADPTSIASAKDASGPAPIAFSPERLIICREFLLPDEENAFLTRGDLPPRHGKCIVCTVFDVARDFFAYRQKGASERAPECLQSFQVEVDCPGGYSKDACLPLGAAGRSTGIFYPYEGSACDLLLTSSAGSPSSNSTTTGGSGTARTCTTWRS